MNTLYQASNIKSQEANAGEGRINGEPLVNAERNPGYNGGYGNACIVA